MEIGSQGEGPGGGGTQVPNGYTLPNGRSGEHQNIRAVNSFEGIKGGCQLQTKNQIRVVACKISFYSIFLST